MDTQERSTTTTAESLAAVTSPVPRASSLPPATFSDPQWFDAEVDLLQRSWVAVARVHQLTSPGQYVTYQLVQDPLVIVCDTDGEIRAFPNVCLHRGTTIVEGSGTTRALRCPNHLWTYNLQGQLIGAPLMSDTDNFDHTSLGLTSLPIETWGGWVFVNTDPDAAPLRPQLTGLDGLRQQADLDALRSIGSLHYTSQWNWKVQVENFTESYHHAGTHPDTLEPATPGKLSTYRDNGGQPWGCVDHQSVIDGVDPFAAIAVFPLLLFATIPPYGMVWYRLQVLNIEHCDLEIHLCIAPDVTDGDAQALRDEVLPQLDAVNAEDVVVNARSQTGLRSRFARPGRLSHLEGGTWQFRAWLVAKLGQR